MSKIRIDKSSFNATNVYQNYPYFSNVLFFLKLKNVKHARKKIKIKIKKPVKCNFRKNNEVYLKPKKSVINVVLCKIFEKAEGT